MSKYHYRDNTHHVSRKKRRRAIVFVLTLVLLLGSGMFIFIDGSRSRTETTVSLGTVTKDPGKEETILLDEPSFSFEAPPGWEAGDRNVNNLYTTVQFKSVAANETAREMVVYINSTPTIEDHKAVNRVVTLKPRGNAFEVGRTSDHCSSVAPSEIANYTGSLIPDPVAVKLADRDVICDVNRSRNIVGSIGDDGYGVGLNGVKYSQEFYFVYTDHSARPDYGVFLNMLRSFRQK